MSSFFSMILRMRYINRWGLMRNTYAENLSTHSLDVAVIAHALGIIANKRLHKDINPDRTAVIALYHDATEIITGDLPTPIKYYNSDITTAYKDIERAASEALIKMLPDDFKDEYSDIFMGNIADEYIFLLVKAADKISALIKCIEELNSGNKEFQSAYTATFTAIEKIQLEEVKIFMQEFFPAFSRTLDEQNTNI